MLRSNASAPRPRLRRTRRSWNGRGYRIATMSPPPSGAWRRPDWSVAELEHLAQPALLLLLGLTSPVAVVVVVVAAPVASVVAVELVVSAIQELVELTAV